MGKIFDALEKNNKTKKRKITIPDKVIKRPNPIRRSTVATESRPTVATDSKLKQPTAGIPKNKKVVKFNNKNKQISSSDISVNLVTYHKPQSIEADLFKMLRTNILFPKDGPPPKTILVCSALPGDGKSFISSNLAVSIANGVEESVLLVDCDIRKPSIHKVFGFGQCYGLSEYLSGDEDISKLMLKTPLQKLSIMPGGQPTMNPTELLSSKKMKNLLTEIKNRYKDRYIIIDSPPPAMAPETHVIEKYVDGIIIVVKAGKTPRKAVTDIIEQFNKKKLLGVVLNQAEQQVKKYYGHTKSYYGE